MAELRTIARPYAEAAFGLAKDENAFGPWSDALSAMAAVVAAPEMKTLIGYAVDLPLDQALEAELDLVHRYATTSHDATEGLVAFADRRKPAYRGE